MSDLEFIAPAKSTTVTFAIEPVHTVISYLVLLENASSAEFSRWVHDTRAQLTPELAETNKLVALLIDYYLDNRRWPSFPAWLEDLAAREPLQVRDRALDLVLDRAEHVLDADSIPPREALLEDPLVFTQLMHNLCDVKGMECVEDEVAQEYQLFMDPVATHERIVDHLRIMWDKYLQSRWEEDLPLLNETVRAFETLDYAYKTPAETLMEVANREVPEQWGEMLEEATEIIFIPSAHIGPYLIGFSVDHIVRIIFGARVPKGLRVSTPALTRSDLITRMSALADDTRLRILHLLAQEGELHSQEIMGRLDLSQSAASRHLRQLTAIGYLIEQRVDGAKVYRLNTNRIADAFSALKEFLE